jgi:hypothetical protein
LAEKVENCAREILAERLEDKLCNAEETKSPFLTKLKAIIGELSYISAMTLSPAVMPALAAACDSGSHHVEPSLNEHLSEKPASVGGWEKINDDKSSGAFFPDNGKLTLISFDLIDNIDELVKMSIGKSKINLEGMREGIVVRPLKEIYDCTVMEDNNGRISFKVVNPEYLIKNE